MYRFLFLEQNWIYSDFSKINGQKITKIKVSAIILKLADQMIPKSENHLCIEIF